MIDFSKTAAAIIKAQACLDAADQSRLESATALTTAVIAHAQHFSRRKYLADKMGISSAYLTHVLNGQRGVSRAFVDKLLSVNQSVDQGVDHC